MTATEYQVRLDNLLAQLAGTHRLSQMRIEIANKIVELYNEFYK